MEEIKKTYPGRPVILAALRVDLRKEPRTIESLEALGDQPCSLAEVCYKAQDANDHSKLIYDQGRRIMERIGAVDYVECSAKTGEGVDGLFHEIALRGLESKQELRRGKGIWPFKRRSLRSRWRSA